jgi:hypothetical protein
MGDIIEYVLGNPLQLRLGWNNARIYLSKIGGFCIVMDASTSNQIVVLITNSSLAEAPSRASG